MPSDQLIIHPEQLMFVKDVNSRTSFLIDPGSQVSILPFDQLKHNPNRLTNGLVLTGVSGKKINTFGIDKLKLKFNEENEFIWSFVLAEVDQPIIGIDFIKHFKLGVVPHLNQLTNHNNNSIIKCTMANGNLSSMNVKIDTDDFVSKLLCKYPDLTSTDKHVAPKHDVYHRIHTIGNPIKCKTRHYGPKMTEIIVKSFKELEDAGFVEQSSSEWSSPIAVTMKPNGEWRICGDYRFLNMVTLNDNYNLKHVHSCNYDMRGADTFSKIDLVKAFYQIMMHPDDKHKTAVATPRGLVQFKVLPFGLKNSAQCFQRFIDFVLGPLSKFCFVYIDDIIVFSKAKDHEKCLEEVFKRLTEFGLRIGMSKCQFNMKSIEFLGYVIDEFGISPSERKIRAILDFPIPKTAAQVKRFLGMGNYYNRFIKNLASKQKPLNKYLSMSKSESKKTIELTEEEIESFNNVRDALADAARLAHPDKSATLILHVDASGSGYGGVLQQLCVDGNNSTLQPLYFVSSTFNDRQMINSVYHRELEAAYQVVKKLSKIIIGQHCILYSDHEPLVKSINNPKDKSPLELRKLITISQYVDEANYIPGPKNVVADALSRLACNSIRLVPKFDYSEIFKAQETDPDLIDRSETDEIYKTEKMIGNDKFKVWIYESHNFDKLIYIPNSKANLIIGAYHGLCHAGYKATVRMISNKFYWPSLKADVREFVKLCEKCQLVKKKRKNIVPVARIEIPVNRFETVHVDLVGPLPRVDGYNMILTVIDRFTRFVTAIPLKYSNTESIIKAFTDGWIKYFGVPKEMITDRGPNVNSKLLKEFCSLFSTYHHTTCSYHPQSNGLIERQHRFLKASMRCEESSEWVARLPIVVLAWNNVIKEDSLFSPSQMVFGTNVRLPCDFFEQSSNDQLNQSDLIRSFIMEMEKLRSVDTCLHNYRFPGIERSTLDECSQVMIVDNARKNSLAKAYKGPYPVIKKFEKYFTIQLPNGRLDNVSKDRLQPAYSQKFSNLSLETIEEEINDLVEDE